MKFIMASKYSQFRLTNKHLHDLLPSREPFDQDVGRLELMRSGVLLDLERTC